MQRLKETNLVESSVGMIVTKILNIITIIYCWLFTLKVASLRRLDSGTCCIGSRGRAIPPGTRRSSGSRRGTRWWCWCRPELSRDRPSCRRLKRYNLHLDKFCFYSMKLYGSDCDLVCQFFSWDLLHEIIWQWLWLIWQSGRFRSSNPGIGKIYAGQERTINSWEDDNIEKESRKGPFLNFRYINYILLLTAKFLP